MVSEISRFVLNSRWAASSIALIAVIILSSPGHASAQAFVDTLQKCGLRRAYAVTIKLLAVYASHILTVKVDPGLGTFDTFQFYLAAALLPSSSAHIPITDLISVWIRPLYNKGKGSHRKFDSKLDGHRRNMQMAINCGATCVRFKLTEKPPGLDIHVVPTSYTVRADPPQDDEVFVMVPRGTPAKYFVETMIQSRSSVMKAIIGGIQIYFATLQLLSVADLQVAAYGYGAFTYTIIPYALGSAINLIALCLTGNYPDLNELRIIDSEAEKIKWKSNDIRPRVLSGIGLFEFFVYLSVVGSITGFRSGISSHAQRGWFISWALIGTVLGSVVRWENERPIYTSIRMLMDDFDTAESGGDNSSMTEQARDESEKGGDRLPMAEGVRDGSPMTESAGHGSTMAKGARDELPVDGGAGDGFPVAGGVTDVLHEAEGVHDRLPVYIRAAMALRGDLWRVPINETKDRFWRALEMGIFGVPTIGGIVTMIQQYMHLYQC